MTDDVEALVHDLNNLVTVIINCAALAEKELTAATGGDDAGDQSERVRRDVGRILAAAERAAFLTHEFLHSEVGDDNDEVIDLNDVIRRLEPVIRAASGDSVVLVTDLAPTVWPVAARACEIERVIINLAVNARDGMPDGGTLTISTHNVVVDNSLVADASDVKQGRYVRLQVGDTGTGMTEEVRVQAFEPYFTTKPKGKGTGLGLTSVHRVITDIGGSAHMHSEVGSGTTLTALLPANPDSS
jgi:signal transduction histidine kinase